MSAQNFISRFFHRRHEPEPTNWQQFQEEQAQRRQADAMRLVAFLRAPAYEICARLGRPVPRQSGPIPPVVPKSDVQLTMRARPAPSAYSVSEPRPVPAPIARRYTDQEIVSMIRTQKPEQNAPKLAPPDWVSGPIDDSWLNSKKQSAPLPPCVASVQYWTEAEMPVQEPKQNVWDEFAELASKSGLLPAIEMPTEFNLRKVETKVAQREAARRERYRLPDIPQKESE